MVNATDVIDNVTRVIIVMSNESSSVESTVANGIDLYLPPFLFVIGLACNTLVIIVMRAPFFSKVSTSLYMSFNALIDNVSILMVLPVHWLSVNFPYAIYRGNNSDLICKALNSLGWASSDLGIILTSAMTLERAIAIKFPLQSVSYCTVKKARYVIGCLIVFILFKDGIFLVSSTMVPLVDETQLCDLDKSDPNIKNFSENILPVIHNVFLALSFTTIIMSNIIIVKSVRDSEGFPPYPSTVRASGGNESVYMSNSLGKTRASSRGRQLTIMLVSDSVTIVICTLPFSIVTSIDLSHTDEGTRHLVFAISLYLLYVNRCANFFLYCVSGERFRHGLKQLFTRSRRKNARPSGFPFNIRNETMARNGSEESSTALPISDSQTRTSFVPSSTHLDSPKLK